MVAQTDHWTSVREEDFTAPLQIRYVPSGGEHWKCKGIFDGCEMHRCYLHCVWIVCSWQAGVVVVQCMFMIMSGRMFCWPIVEVVISCQKLDETVSSQAMFLFQSVTICSEKPQNKMQRSVSLLCSTMFCPYWHLSSPFFFFFNDEISFPEDLTYNIINNMIRYIWKIFIRWSIFSIGCLVANI